MDPKFLRDVQAHGWVVEAVSEDACIAKCRNSGCTVRLRLRQSSLLQSTGPRNSGQDFSVTSFDDVRVFLRDRRQALTLNINEVEEIAGMTPDFLAKFERDTWADAGTVRQPNVQTFVEWAGSLGYEVVLRPIGLPAKALSYIAQTRDRFRARVKRNRLSRGQSLS